MKNNLKKISTMLVMVLLGTNISVLADTAVPNQEIAEINTINIDSKETYNNITTFRDPKTFNFEIDDMSVTNVQLEASATYNSTEYNPVRAFIWDDNNKFKELKDFSDMLNNMTTSIKDYPSGQYTLAIPKAEQIKTIGRFKIKTTKETSQPNNNLIDIAITVTVTCTECKQTVKIESNRAEVNLNHDKTFVELQLSDSGANVAIYIEDNNKNATVSNKGALTCKCDQNSNLAKIKQGNWTYAIGQDEIADLFVQDQQTKLFKGQAYSVKVIPESDLLTLLPTNNTQGSLWICGAHKNTKGNGHYYFGTDDPNLLIGKEGHKPWTKVTDMISQDEQDATKRALLDEYIDNILNNPNASNRWELFNKLKATTSNVGGLTLNTLKIKVGVDPSIKISVTSNDQIEVEGAFNWKKNDNVPVYGSYWLELRQDNRSGNIGKDKFEKIFKSGNRFNNAILYQKDLSANKIEQYDLKDLKANFAFTRLGDNVDKWGSKVLIKPKEFGKEYEYWFKVFTPDGLEYETNKVKIKVKEPTSFEASAGDIDYFGILKGGDSAFKVINPKTELQELGYELSKSSEGFVLKKGDQLIPAPVYIRTWDRDISSAISEHKTKNNNENPFIMVVKNTSMREQYTDAYLNEELNALLPIQVKGSNTAGVIDAKVGMRAAYVGSESSRGKEVKVLVGTYSGDRFAGYSYNMWRPLVSEIKDLSTMMTNLGNTETMKWDEKETILTMYDKNKTLVNASGALYNDQAQSYIFVDSNGVANNQTLYMKVATVERLDELTQQRYPNKTFEDILKLSLTNRAIGKDVDQITRAANWADGYLIDYVAIENALNQYPIVEMKAINAYDQIVNVYNALFDETSNEQKQILQSPIMLGAKGKVEVTIAGEEFSQVEYQVINSDKEPTFTELKGSASWENVPGISSISIELPTTEPGTYYVALQLTSKDKVVRQVLNGPFKIQSIVPQITSDFTSKNFILPEGLSNISYNVSFQAYSKAIKYEVNLGSVKETQLASKTLMEFDLDAAIVTLSINAGNIVKLKKGTDYTISIDGNKLIITLNDNFNATEGSTQLFDIYIPTRMGSGIAYGNITNSYLKQYANQKIGNIQVTVTATPRIQEAFTKEHGIRQEAQYGSPETQTQPVALKYVPMPKIN